MTHRDESRDDTADARPVAPLLPPIRAPEADQTTAMYARPPAAPPYEAPTVHHQPPRVPEQPTMPYGRPVVHEPPPDYAGAPVARPRRRGPLVAALVVAALVLAGAWYADVPARLGLGGTTPRATAPTTAPTTEPTTAVPTAVGMVAVAPEVTDPRAGAVAELFDGYFSAINARDTQRALAAYDPAGVIDTGDPGQVEQFAREISTTEDSDVTLHAVADDPTMDGAVQARVTFTSRQDPGFGPRQRPDETCTRWDVTLRLTPDGGRYRIREGQATSAPC